MGNRSRYKRRIVEHGHKICDNETNGRSNPVPKPESKVRVAEKAQGDQRSLVQRMFERLSVLTDWLEWKKTGSTIGVIALALAFAFWLWPRPTPGLQIILNKGGPAIRGICTEIRQRKSQKLPLFFLVRIRLPNMGRYRPTHDSNTPRVAIAATQKCTGRVYIYAYLLLATPEMWETLASG